jgi:Leucine-rich repeat (LRR) protein
MKVKFRYLSMVFILLINTIVLAQNNDNKGAREFAAEFFNARKAGLSVRKAPMNTKPRQTITQAYQSPVNVKTPLYVFENTDGGFAMVAQSNNTYKVVGYSDEERFDIASIPPQLSALMVFYEESLLFYAAPAIKMASVPVVSPLLAKYGIRLNQYTHTEFGSCPTGCVATAVTQIMLYHAARRGQPIKGYGSYCYTDATYGQICTDFSGITYSSPEKLSLHVGNSMEMQYCGSPYGSIPNKDFSEGLENHFRYYTSTAEGSDYFIKNELEHQRPVYITLNGDPVGHAFVLDGYDNRGYYHLDFGWGGSYNGYYLLNTNEFMGINNLKFFNNISSPRIITPSPIQANVQDSLALVAIHNALGGFGATNWDLSVPVYKWPGVLLMNGRVIKLSISSLAPPSSEQSIAPEIGNLTALRELSLYGCFNGYVPSSISNLTDLQRLNIVNSSIYAEPILHKGNLKCELPADIGRLVNIVDINISNAMSGIMPPSIGNLSKLEMLRITHDTTYFGKGNLKGKIPDEIGNLRKLRVLSINNQQINGVIPSAIGKLTELYEVDLSGNQLSGSVPLMNYPKLTYLFLNDNLLTKFEEGTSSCPVLKRIDLHNNLIAGELPSYIGNYSELVTLNLSNNQFSSIPESIGNLTQLEKFDINNNLLQALRNGIALCVSLKKLSASHNQIAVLPDNLGQSGNIEYLDLSFNNITSIPDDLGNSNSLTQVYFNNNKITSIPFSFGNINDNAIVYLDNNEMQGLIPEKLMLSEKNKFVRLNNNKFVFDDIPQSNQLKFGVRDQKTVNLNKQVFNVQLGDTVKIDIRDISRLKHSGNKYYWLAYPEFQSLMIKDDRIFGVEENPVLTLVINEHNISNTYYCKVFNTDSPTFTYNLDNPSVSYPCLYYLNTDTISFKLATDEEILAQSYNEGFVTSLASTPGKIVSDKTVTLVPPLKVKRGIVSWEASSDGNNWVKISNQMERADLKANIKSMTSEELVLSPKNNAYYRCCIEEYSCDPLYSDKLLMKSLGTVLFDEMINVTQKMRTISVDSIEVVVPLNFHDNDFRLTITKLENGPASPAGVIAGKGYDVKVSFAETFDIPLLIKLKNIDKSKVKETEIDRFQAVYFDDKHQEWKPFENARLSLKDSTLNIMTNHLTKMKWWWYAEEYRMGFTDVYERNNIVVFYKDVDVDFINQYRLKQTAQQWHVPGIPLMVQDVTEFLPIVRAEYKRLGLSVPDGKFKVYIQDLNGEDGCVGIIGMLNGYLTIGRSVSTPVELAQSLAHEYMHYTQDYYISANGGNQFWMEAHASLSDRIVWDDNFIPFCESEEFLKVGLSGNVNYTFNSLANSWDAWDISTASNAYYSFFRTEETIQYYYTAGTFLHYMRSWRAEAEKLEPATLLKETSWFGNWRTYLASYVSNHLNSILGDEYEDYVKYILSGENDKFTVINKTGNPYAYIQDPKNKNVFTHPVTYRFEKGDNMVQTDQLDIEVPYMASKIVLLENINPDTMVLVNYKRKHEFDIDQRVYHVSYNPDLQKMNFVDISDSVQYNILLESRNKDNAVSKFQNINFLLFINKEYIGASSLIKDFDVSIELTAMPVLNIEKICLLDIYNGSSPHLHSYTNKPDYVSMGSPSAEWFSQIAGMKAQVVNSSVTRKIINNHTYQTTSKYTFIYDQGMIKGIPTMKDSTIYTQTIEHDLLTGGMKITENEYCVRKMYTYIEFVNGVDGNIEEHLVYNGYTDYIEERKESIGLDGILNFIQPNKKDNGFDEVYGNKIETFKTNNTTETRQVVNKMDGYVKLTEYSKNGTVSSVKENRYVSTDYSNPNLVLYFIIKTKKD